MMLNTITKKIDAKVLSDEQLMTSTKSLYAFLVLTKLQPITYASLIERLKSQIQAGVKSIKEIEQGLIELQDRGYLKAINATEEGEIEYQLKHTI